MNGLVHIRNLIRNGAPTNGDEIREIIRVALEGAAGQANDWQHRLSLALTEIVLGRLMHNDTYQARADALAVIDEISNHGARTAR
jgi:hypothetical protein